MAEKETPPQTPPETKPQSVTVAESAPRIVELETQVKEKDAALKDRENKLIIAEADRNKVRSEHETLLGELNRLKGIPSARPGKKSVFDEINEFLWGGK